ncbi:MAG: hypothetical protein E7571_04425 [Ruminococcaceae bacterium]|nr:hypothetical protein [Oscillospiraceae bacterium]
MDEKELELLKSFDVKREKPEQDEDEKELNPPKKSAKAEADEEKSADVDIVVDDDDESDENEDKKKARINFKNLSKKQLIILIVAAVFAVVLILWGAVGIAGHDVNPFKAISNITSGDEQKIVGKWQNDTDVAAYEFFEDGTYKSYTLTFSYDAQYQIDGKTLTLSNPATKGFTKYEFEISEEDGKTFLTMTMLEQNGIKMEGDKQKVYKYQQVDHINTKSINDLFSNIPTPEG